MEYIERLAPDKSDQIAIEQVLQDSLRESEPHCPNSLTALKALGIGTDAAKTLLACYKSREKYGYDISEDTIAHLFDLSRKKNGHALVRLFRSPFLLAKASWLYEHAPYFYFFDNKTTKDRDALIYGFAEHYVNGFLDHSVDLSSLKPLATPYRVLMTTFWERNLIDPTLLINKAVQENIEGIELNFDFHPFNYTKLLPEELTKEKREWIRKTHLRTGVKVDIHSPIVGPYTPSPDPAGGSQCFFDPLDCFEIQQETIELAKDIQAGCVTIHMVDISNLKKISELIECAAGSDVRVTVENYCQTDHPQTGDVILSCLEEICRALPREIKEKNFGVTLDVGHLNIEGDDPLLAAENIGNWCLKNKVYLRVHATDNYGDLLFSPPAYSADVHGNVSGRGINNAIIIKMLRCMGHRFNVVAEQIQPLTEDDIRTIHSAQTVPFDRPYDACCKQGMMKLAGEGPGPFINEDIIDKKPYQFLSEIEGVDALKEYLLYRRIQRNKLLSVEEAKRISKEFIRTPLKLRSDLTHYIDDFLSLIQMESGSIKKSDVDLVCQNISGALFGAISNEHLNQIFSEERTYRKGEIICEQNGPGQEMFFIKKGDVIVSIDGSCVASLGPGEIFGEMSLFYNINRSARIIALKDRTVVGVLSRSGLEGLFRSSQPYAYDLIFRFFNILPGRLRNLNDKYKTAIHALHLIFNGNEAAMPDIRIVPMGLRQKQADFLPELRLEEARETFSEIRKIDAGQKLFSQGDDGKGAYYIFEGTLKAVTRSPDGQEIVLGELNEGEVCGEMALIDDKPRSADIFAVTRATLGFIPKKQFNELIETKSELAFRLMGFICLRLFRSILRLDKFYSEIKKSVYSFSGGEPKSHSG